MELPYVGLYVTMLGPGQGLRERRDYQSEEIR